MDKLNLEGFITDEVLIKITKELMSAENEVICFNIVKKLSIGQLEKLRAILSCQYKEINNSFSLLSLLLAALAISIPALDMLVGNIKLFYIYVFPLAIAGSLIYFILKSGSTILNNSNLHNKKINYLIFIVDSELKLRNRKE
ncbi:MAG: hypothetical protein LPK00_14460 [Bacillaceae bacterium]|nr:hypothetical protein [Bacillaceae bacterium]